MKVLSSKKLLIILAFFAFAIGIFAFINLRQPKGNLIARRDLNISKKSKLTNNAINNIDLVIPNRNFVYPSDDIRDPFQKKPIIAVNIKPSRESSKPLNENIILVGILWSDKKPMAILKDSRNESHLVKLGDGFNNIKVVDIKPNVVRITKDDKVMDLMLWTANTKM